MKKRKRGRGSKSMEHKRTAKPVAPAEPAPLMPDYVTGRGRKVSVTDRAKMHREDEIRKGRKFN